MTKRKRRRITKREEKKKRKKKERKKENNHTSGGKSKGFFSHTCFVTFFCFFVFTSQIYQQAKPKKK
jgi:hypothetical protein